MTKHPWPILTHLRGLADAGQLHRIQPATFDVVADRLDDALASEAGEPLREAEETLKATLDLLVKASPTDVRDAVRGARNADPNLLTAFWAGQAAFAQAFVARVLDKRGDHRMSSRLTDRRYERYVRALLDRPLSGEDLVAAIGETKETVSRKLSALALLGAIERRRQGNHVINVLSPAARAYLKHRNIAPWVVGNAPPLAPDIAAALETRSRSIPEHMRRSPVLGAAR